MPRKEGMERWLDINFFWYFFVSGRTCLPSMWKSSRCRVRLLTSLPRRLARFLWVSLTWNNTLDLIWALIFDHWISFESDPGCRKPCKHQRSNLFPLCAIHPKGLKSMLEKGNECVIIFVLQENFSAMTRLDQNRAAGQIAEKVNSLFYLSEKCLFKFGHWFRL